VPEDAGEIDQKRERENDEGEVDGVRDQLFGFHVTNIAAGRPARVRRITESG